VAAFGANGKRLREAFSGADPEFIRFEPPLEDAPWARLLVNSRASLVTLRPEAGHVSFPSKALSAMAAGNAILAVAPPDCDLSMLIKRHDCGWVIEPDDFDTLESTLRLVLTQPQRMAPFRQRAREAVREFYDLDVLAEKWERLILAPPA